MLPTNKDKKSPGRSPNSECVVCGVPLYRRPGELARVRHVACMAHRAEAQKLSGITPAQHAALGLGRLPGDNGRTGYAQTEETKRKIREGVTSWCRENPEEARQRAPRGEAHHKWAGGVTQLNQAVRRLTEYRRWAKAVRDRDGACVRCGAASLLEAHHRVDFARLLAAHGVTHRDHARGVRALWDISNGVTLCRPCHYAEHGRTARANHRD